MFGRTLVPHFVAAVAWAVILQSPFGSSLFPALVTLAVVHVLAPVWCVFVARGDALHRKFATGPLLLFAIDIGFIVVAWRQDLWRDLTTVFVPILGAVAVIALLYAAGMTSLLGRLRKRRPPT